MLTQIPGTHQGEIRASTTIFQPLPFTSIKDKFLAISGLRHVTLLFLLRMRHQSLDVFASKNISARA